jgi:hypothetical protein
LNTLYIPPYRFTGAARFHRASPLSLLLALVSGWSAKQELSMEAIKKEPSKADNQ